MTHLDDWQRNLENYCENYNIPLHYLADTLNDPKVIPMIRGKAFEFSVLLKLNSLLDNRIWLVEKPYLNPQLGSHDEDVLVTHLETNIRIRIECKLSAKGRINTTNKEIKVKCMRSRTLGEEQVNRLFELRGVSREQLKIHNDQYLPIDFDYVVTSIANAFYKTDSNGIYVWQLTEPERYFLQQKYGNHSDDVLKDYAFNSFYIANSHDLAIYRHNSVNCTRRNCTDWFNCGFIPNYPSINFDQYYEALHPWYNISDSNEIFSNYVFNS